jgi:hypothetical protein
MDIRIRGLSTNVVSRAHARAKAAGETLSVVVRRLVERYADSGEPGSAGGRARASSLTEGQRHEAARHAARARWGQSSE